MVKSSKIYIAGHKGMVGSAIIRKLQKEGFTNLLQKTKEELDLLDQQAVRNFFEKEKPEYVVLAAARVGGIKANMSYPAEFLYQNLQIQNNVIWSAHEFGCKKLLFLSSSCVYPRECPQPMKEEYFMTGRPEPTNEGYAYAKISGMKLCEKIYEQFNKKFVSCMPTNIYGENDNFDIESSHVIPSLIRRIHEAKTSNTKEVVIWGTGNSRREFMYVDDLGDAIYFLLQNYEDKEFVNIGTGIDISIKELAYKLKEVIGFEGELVFDATKPDGMPRKLLDISKMNSLGIEPKLKLEEGLKITYEYFITKVFK